jgi:hypothetical protein
LEPEEAGGVLFLATEDRELGHREHGGKGGRAEEAVQEEVEVRALKRHKTGKRAALVRDW